MVTAAGMVNVQQQRRQEKSKGRNELNETVNGRLDMLDGIALALQRVTANPVPKPYWSSDLIPRKGEGSNDKGEFRHFMSDLHLWVQAWSNEGQTRLVSVERSDKYDDNTMSVDGSQEHVRTIEASLYQVLHRTTANEPLRLVQQTEGNEVFESCHSIVRRYDQVNMSEKTI